MASAVTISRADFCDYWCNSARAHPDNLNSNLISVIITRCSLSNLCVKQLEELEEKVCLVSKYVMGLWKKLNRGKDKLMKSKWYTNPNPIVLLERKVSNNLMGCPKKCYVECAPQTRMSKALKATSSATQLEVLHAAFHVLKSSVSRDWPNHFRLP